MSASHTFREYATDLTSSYVASQSFDVSGLTRHAISVSYDPDEDDGICEIIVQASDDPKSVTDANSDWRTLGVAARATAIVTYTADTSLKLTAAAAGTKLYLSAVYTDEPAQKIRVQAKETFSGAGTNVGNVRIVGYSYPH